MVLPKVYSFTTIGQACDIILNSHWKKQKGKRSYLSLGKLYHSHPVQLVAQHLAKYELKHFYYCVHLCDSFPSLTVGPYDLHLTQVVLTFTA